MTVQAEEILDRVYAKKYLKKEVVVAYFDTLAALPLDEMRGRWIGKEVLTGHSMEGLLEEVGWYGKRFDTPDQVHPLVFQNKNGKLLSINPIWFPMDRLIGRFDRGLKL
ncbi:MAG: GXWXG domain-containing protein, partial [Bacteroidota bacterium]